jgi:hypothetical protein
MLQCRNSSKPVVMRDSAPCVCRAEPLDVRRHRRIGCGSLALAHVERFFTQKSHAAPSCSQLPEFKGVVRARGIFDSHRPLHFPPSLANASQIDLQLTASGTLVDVASACRGFPCSLVRWIGFDPELPVVSGRCGRHFCANRRLSNGTACRASGYAT